MIVNATSHKLTNHHFYQKYVVLEVYESFNYKLRRRERFIYLCLCNDKDIDVITYNFFQIFKLIANGVIIQVREYNIFRIFKAIRKFVNASKKPS